MPEVKAYKVKDLDWHGGVTLYKLSQEIPSYYEGNTTSYVVVSSISAGPISPSTVVLASDKDGLLTEFAYMAGSQHGKLATHEDVIKSSGWTLVKEGQD